jgi:hypothetical protein
LLYQLSYSLDVLSNAYRNTQQARRKGTLLTGRIYAQSVQQAGATKRIRAFSNAASAVASSG